MKVFWSIYGVLLLIFGSFLTGWYLDKTIRQDERMEVLKIREVTALEQISLHLANIRSDMTVCMSRNNI